jgi:outer membrane protein assembly factor BamB
VPFEQTFNKLSLRAGWDKLDDYLLLDGFGRGNHMHFDANAILRYARGGVPLLVDGEYIKNLPKYHNSLVIIRDGQAELAPAVTRLDRADMLDSLGVTRTSLVQYNGADWTRTMLWRPNGYLLVGDTVTARQAGDYSLRCCWRPWGEAKLDGPTLTADQPPMRLTITNADGSTGRLETLKMVGALAVSRYSQQVGVKLAPGQSYRFLNLVHAEPVKAARELPLRRVAPGVSIIGAGAQAEAVVLPDAGPQVAGLTVAAEVLVLSPDRLALAGATSFADGGAILTASAPVSLELHPAGGKGVLIAGSETEVKLRLAAGAALKMGAQSVTADGAGVATFKVGPGRHAVTFPAFPLYPAVAGARAQLSALPALAVAAGGRAAAEARPRWSVPGFDPQPLPLPVASVTTPATNLGKGPIEKLTDGMYQGSTNSVMWPAGQPAVATIELVTPGEVKSVVLREWHMVPGWDVADRKLEVSNDGFQRDIRVVPGPFVETGQEVMGTNINTLYEVPVGQQVRQLRLTWTPARPDATVYVADVEVRGLRTGQLPQVTALAAGDLTGDGRPEVLTASEGGQVRALDEAGKVLWTYSGAIKGRVNSLACADVTGDAKAEVMVGGNGQVLSLLAPDGKLLWTVSPPRFRGIASDVITVFPADVNGDRRPEIICGTLNWQYFAYDAAGKMLWSHVIYAHSATVGCAADLDGDGKDEIVAGCVYYTLNVIDHDGSRMWRGSPVGPEMTAVAAADVTGDGKPEVFTGVDGGELYAFSPTGDKLWQLNLGDKVTRMLPLDVNGDGKQELVCAAESACVFAVDGAGKIVWRTTLPDGCGDMAVRRAADDKPELVVSAGAAGLMTLGADGKITGQHAVGRTTQMVVSPGTDVFVAGESGSVAAVTLQ